jgi:hypothetical protein
MEEERKSRRNDERERGRVEKKEIVGYQLFSG